MSVKPAAPIKDLSRLCLHTITTKPWPIEVAAQKYAAAGIRAITVWREALADRNVLQVGEMLRAYGLSVVSLCYGGFFASASAEERQRAIRNTLNAVDQAAALGASLLVLVCGADPRQSLDKSRLQFKTGIETVLEHAEVNHIKLAVEPLHPMYADTRSAVNTLKQANDMVEIIGSSNLGVVVDAYHLWWDPELEEQIHRAAELEALAAFHISDWKTPTSDLHYDRGLPGEGCIPLRTIRSWMEQAGFSGYHEIEILSNRWWQTDMDEFLKKIIDAYLSVC